MKLFKSFTAMLLALMLVLCSFAVVSADEEAAALEQLPLGNAHYAIQAPAGYTDVGVTEEEFRNGLVSCYLNPALDIEIDVYQFAPAEEGFEAYTKALCEENGASDYAYEEDFNGVPAASYYEETTLLETVCHQAAFYDCGEYYIGVNFYFNKGLEGAMDTVTAMAQSFGVAETETFRLGSSPYFVTLVKGYYQGEVTDEEAAAGLVGYYLNDALLFDFDVYENPVDDSLTLADVAAQLCDQNNGSDLTARDFDGVAAYTYNGHAEYDGTVYDTVTCVLDSTNGTCVAVVCWLDNEPMRYMALGMLDSIKTEDELVKDEPMTLRVGSSDYAITLPTTFVQGAVSEEEYKEEGYVACYYSPYGVFDIDLYQCRIEEELPTLAEFTEKDAADYAGTEISLDEEINGVTVTSYRSDEIYGDVQYRCATYTFQDEEYYYQLCFYWTDEDVAEDVEAVMATLAPIEKETVTLGRSAAYSLTVPAGMTAETVEVTDGLEYVYTRYEKAPLTFIVYDFVSAETHLPLEECAKAEAEYYNGSSLTFSEINGVPVASYYYTRTDALYNTYAVLTYVIENGADGYIDIDFYVDDYVSAYQALDIINTLTK